MCAENGEMLLLGHHAAWVSNFSATPEHQWENVIWVFYHEKWDNDSIIAAFEQNDRICVGTGLAGRHREQPMAGTFLSVYWYEGFSHTPGFRTAYRACPAGTCQGKGDQTIISRPGDSFSKEAHPSAIEHFVAARQLASHPVSVSRC